MGDISCLLVSVASDVLGIILLGISKVLWSHSLSNKDLPDEQNNIARIANVAHCYSQWIVGAMR